MQFWKWLSGKKRTIGLILIFVAHAPHLAELAGPQIVDILLYFGMGLGGVGIVHSAVKQKRGAK